MSKGASTPHHSGRSGVPHRHVFFFWYATITASSLWLRSGFPVQAVADAGFDDGLFVRTAYALASGDWLGPYDRVTLAKGMFYPFFVALSSAAGLPLKIAEHLAYLGAAGGIAFVVARWTSAALGPLVYAALAFNPMLWHPSLARVVREGLYVSLSLALLGLFAVVLATRRRRGATALALGSATGATLGAFWMTREEGLWIVPALAGMSACAIAVQALHWRTLTTRHPRLAPGLARPLSPLACQLATIGVVAVLVVAGVKAMNFARYGVFVSTEFHAQPFVRAYGALSRIRHDSWRPYVVFPADARRRAYEASPAARELQPFLEGDNGRSWKEAGCGQLGIADCPEILSGWFMWALRDAVWLAGHYRSAPQAMDFYTRLADEIDDACEAGRIPCGPARTTLAPPFRAERLGPAVQAGATIAGMMWRLGDGDIGVNVSLGRSEDIETFGNLVGPVARPALRRYELAGRLVNATPSVVPQVTDALGHRRNAILELDPSSTPATGERRFRILTDCPPTECRLHADALVLEPLQAGTQVQADGLTVGLERARDLHGTFGERRLALQQRVARAIAAAYATVWPFLSALALVGWLGWARRARWTHAASLALLLLGAGCMLAVATRIALLAYLDATSIPSANVLYASPASPMVILFTVLGLGLGASCIRRREHRPCATPAPPPARSA